MANTFPGTGTVQLENGTAVSLCIQTTVADNNTRDAITLYENSGQASGRQAISWYNGGNDYYKARLWTEVGGGYNATTFGIDVADDARTLATRMVIRNGFIGIGTSSPASKLHVESGQIRVHGAPSDAITGTQGYYLANTGNNEAYNWQMSCNFNLGLWTFSNSAGGGWGLRGPVITQSGNFGIGTSSPSDKLHILGADNGITICASASNRPVLSLYSAANLMLKLSANSTFGAIADNSGSDVMYFKGGCVSIGTSTPSYKLHVNGTFYAAGSSQDYKQSICNYNTDSCMFMKLTPVTYQYKEEWCHLGKELKSETQIGLIAEDVAEVYPELAILVNEDDQKIVRNVDYEKLSIVLLSEVQKLRKELDELKTK